MSAERVERMVWVVTRIVFLLCAVVAGVVAWRTGGGAAPVRRPPSPAVRDANARGETTGEQTLEVATRLVEIAGEARFEAPRANAVTHLLSAHWRKMRPVHYAVDETAARFVSTLTLRTSASEKQWERVVAKSDAGEKKWAPDPRVWNMNEGSFEQRDVLIAPTPATITYRIRIPTDAELAFAEGTLNATAGDTVFAITVVDEKGAAHDVYRHALPPSAARRWTDRRCDLARFAGQTVELRISTEAGPPLVDSAPEGQKQRRAKDKEAEKEAVLAAPSAAVALWGNPTIFTRTRARLPMNVLWIVVDALRSDVVGSFHDDEDDQRMTRAPLAPLDARLPKVPGLTPVLDRMSARCVRFLDAHSTATWTRPGTISMLAGARSPEVGLDSDRWLLPSERITRFYASDPPLMPLVLRKHGAVSVAFVNNFFMAGYAPVGVDMGFEHLNDHRMRLKDTQTITDDASAWIRENKGKRFFMFVNYNSPHEPWEPPSSMLERVPQGVSGPRDESVRKYMAEAGKDDQAIGELLRTLGEAGLEERTIVVVTADHGETLSTAHTGTTLENIPVRFHHAVGNYEETTRVPILLCAPGRLRAGAAVKARVRNSDIAPTLLDLLGVEAPSKMTGRSLQRPTSGWSSATVRGAAPSSTIAIDSSSGTAARGRS
jgi:hypothetical protein